MDGGDNNLQDIHSVDEVKAINEDAMIESDSDDTGDNYNDYLDTASDMMLIEVRSQYESTLSLISSHTQKSGIILAFTSVMFIEMFRLPVFTLSWSILLTLMAACFLFGIIGILNGRVVPLGLDSSIMSSDYNSANLYNLRYNT